MLNQFCSHGEKISQLISGIKKIHEEYDKLNQKKIMKNLKNAKKFMLFKDLIDSRDKIKTVSQRIRFADFICFVFRGCQIRQKKLFQKMALYIIMESLKVSIQGRFLDVHA